MKKMTNKELKKCMLDILEYIDGVCRKHKIKYSLYYGSLIGAIRHKGIIPWDDDIDLIMLNKEYEKLVKVLKKEKGRYQFVDHSTNSSYVLTFGKVVDTKTFIKQDNIDEGNMNGVYVDIFSFNNIPDKPSKFYYYRLLFYQLLLYSYVETGVDKKDKLYIVKKVRNFVARILGKEFLYKKYDNLCKKYNDKKRDCLMSNWPEYQRPINEEICYRKNYKDYMDVDFDGIKAMIIKNYDEVLKAYYGDYMTPPPKDKQVFHGYDAYWK